MKDDELISIFNSCYRYALRFCGKQFAEDLAAECVLQAIAHPGYKQIRFRVCDALRKLGHMTRSGYERDPLFTSHDISDLSIAESKQVVTYPRIDEMDIVPMVKHMEARERAMVILRYMWGMTNREIGFLFGVDETIISKLISEAIRSLSSILKMQ